MAYWCVKYVGQECDGCGDCDPQPLFMDAFGDPVYEGDRYYDFNNGWDAIHEDNLEKWAKQFLKEARA